MIDATSKALFHALAQVESLKRFASRYGMRPGGFARRFIAGESVEEAIASVAELPSRGLRLTLDYLGESSTTFDEAAAAAHEYIHIIDAIVRSGIERNISVKLTQLGLDVDRATAVDNMRRILEPADQHGFFVRMDGNSLPPIARCRCSRRCGARSIGVWGP
jgi:proline dehydrogenase